MAKYKNVLNNNPQKNINNNANRGSKMIHAKQQNFIGCKVFEEKSPPIKEKSKLKNLGKN
ncbi:hypothetical protein [Borreliella lusitaniae]|uniref:hypothetical protein n=1 Tax=Borreliella lusitaniae TaxID=100177 RepID=UPI003AB5393F